MAPNELSEQDRVELGRIFGEEMGKQMIKVFESMKSAAETAQKIRDAQHETILTKLDTIISEVRK